MTEDQKDQPTAEERVPATDSGTTPSPVAEGTGQAIPMPPVSTPETSGTDVPPAPQQPETAGADVSPAPQQPDTPPLGVPQGVPAPGGYAMGALAGNPNLGGSPGYHYGG